MKKIILILAITTIALYSCSKSDDATTVPVNPDLTLTKTERIVAAPIRNISSYWWATKLPGSDKFMIHNSSNDVNSGMMIYDIASNTFTDKTKSSNVVAAGYISQLLQGNGVIYYIANEFNKYDIATDTWTEESTLFPSSIHANHGESKGCVLTSKGKVFFVGGRDACKTVKYFNWNTNTWNFAADYPIAISSGPETVTDNQNALYSLGGFQSGMTSKEFYKYDDITNSWTKLTDAPVAPFNFSSYNNKGMVMVKNKYVVFLGNDKLLHIYNTETSKWQDNTIETAITGNYSGWTDVDMEVSTDGTKIYILYVKSNSTLGIQEYK